MCARCDRRSMTHHQPFEWLLQQAIDAPPRRAAIVEGRPAEHATQRDAIVEAPPRACCAVSSKRARHAPRAEKIMLRAPSTISPRDGLPHSARRGRCGHEPGLWRDRGEAGSAQARKAEHWTVGATPTVPRS